MNSHGGKIVFDLDGVVVGPKTDSYDDCKPNTAMVKRMRELKQLGYTIAIHTSRNVRTHDGNIGKLTADTAVSISNYLKTNNIPCDELYVGKPWVGKTGFYVDDRAMTPSQFLSLNVGELLSMAREEAFGYDNPSPQGWIIINNDGQQYSDRLAKAIRLNRDNGYRTAITNSENFSVMVKQALKRDGVVCFDHIGVGTAITILANELALGQDSVLVLLGDDVDICSVVSPLEEAESILKENPGERWPLNSDIGTAAAFYAKDVVIDNTASMRPVRFNTLPDDGILKSRHFNEVRIVGSMVYKQSTDPVYARKLELERQWLQRVKHGVDVVLAPGGYATRLMAGPLSEYLAYHSFKDSDTSIDEIAHALARLWHSLDDDTDSGEVDYKQEFTTLFVEKSIARLQDLETHLDETAHKNWIINGVAHGSPVEMVQKILANLEPFKAQMGERFIFHGDLCPGNILMDGYPLPGLRLIDPRATTDGQTLALYGDPRYDLGKLSHALNWGYDTILEEWYDYDEEEGTDDLSVSLSLWDEELTEAPPRKKLFDLSKDDISVGKINLNDPEIQLIAALQLITCAPLHMDDPKRAKALIARGLQAGVQTFERIFKES